MEIDVPDSAILYDCPDLILVNQIDVFKHHNQNFIIYITYLECITIRLYRQELNILLDNNTAIIFY
jgi:hypothetical protein